MCSCPHNVGFWILFCIYSHYYCVVNTDPGGRQDALFDELIEQERESVGCGSGPVAPEITDCVKCHGLPRPPRAHHCSICDRCVLKMDHQ